MKEGLRRRVQVKLEYEWDDDYTPVSEEKEFEESIQDHWQTVAEVATDNLQNYKGRLLSLKINGKELVTKKASYCRPHGKDGTE